MKVIKKRKDSLSLAISLLLLIDKEQSPSNSAEKSHILLGRRLGVQIN